MQNKEKSTMW